MPQFDGRKDDDYLGWLLSNTYSLNAQCNQQRAICASCLDQLTKVGVIQ